MIQGHCECKRVSYQADCEISDLCHCSQCRRLHGAVYATFAGELCSPCDSPAKLAREEESQPEEDQL